jgi:AcrR family transcriptional regulator
MSSKQYHHGDLKVSLIEAANKILLRDGADALSLRAIAAEVGVSHMAPYAHFKNKKVLVQSIAEAGFVQMAETMQAVANELTLDNSISPGELVLAYGASYLEFATKNPQLYRLMLGQVETTGRKNKKEEVTEEANSNLVKTNSIKSPFMESSKKPFILLREAFALRGDSDEKVKAQALGAWSMVHGMAALIIEGHIQVPEGTSFKHFLAAATPLSDQLN